MRAVTAGQNWGITTAAGPRIRPGGEERCRMPDGPAGLWVINSIGRSYVRGHSVETELVALDVLHHEA